MHRFAELPESEESAHAKDLRGGAGAKASGLHKRVGALWVGAMTLVTLPLGYGSA